MLKHFKKIGNYDIVCIENAYNENDYQYVVRNKGMDVDMFTSLEKAEQFITEVLQKYNGEQEND